MSKIKRILTKCSWGQDRGGCPGAAELDNGLIAVIGTQADHELLIDLAGMIGDGETAVVLDRAVLTAALARLGSD